MTSHQPSYKHEENSSQAQNYIFHCFVHLMRILIIRENLKLIFVSREFGLVSASASRSGICCKLVHNCWFYLKRKFKTLNKSFGDKILKLQLNSSGKLLANKAINCRVQPFLLESIESRLIYSISQKKLIDINMKIFEMPIEHAVEWVDVSERWKWFESRWRQRSSFRDINLWIWIEKLDTDLCKFSIKFIPSAISFASEIPAKKKMLLSS